MKIVVCVRLDGDVLGPFDAAAYEEALRLPDADITLLSMGPASAKEPLHALTRLGASRAVLLSDPAFAGSDTLATAYELALAVKRISPDLVLTGRQTLIGDTGQTGPMLATLLRLSLLTNVMQLTPPSDKTITVLTRDEGEMTASLPALLTVERTCELRFPRLRSRLGEIEVWNAEDVGADRTRCGLGGSPTRVLATHENESGKRKCQFISRDQLPHIIEAALTKNVLPADSTEKSLARLSSVVAVGDAPTQMASSVSDHVHTIPLSDEDTLICALEKLSPDAVLFGSDDTSKRIAACVAARLSLGLCADCTAFDVEDDILLMYRPARSGQVIAKIKSLTRPALATVRTASQTKESIVVAAGFGVKDALPRVTEFAEELGATLCASRKMVDNACLPYSAQVGLTGRTVAPPVYIAIGISGAVHHIAGMSRAGTVIAINPDKDAPIFEYADYGILEKFE